jgi:hypothetical protein
MIMIMMKKEIEKFNLLLSEFLEKIISKFEAPKLKTYRRAFMMLKETYPETPVNLFMVGCINYKSEILNRNDAFFFKDEKIKENVKKFGNFSQDCGLDVYWNELTPNTKKAIWDYIQSLFVLGEIIINNNTETFNKYNALYASDYKNELENFQNVFSKNFLNKLNS